MKMMDMSAGERPRERMLAQGAGVLSDGELLAVILRGGTASESALDLARRLLGECGGSLSGLSAMPVDRMLEIPGIGACKAAGIVAALELGRRFIREETLQPGLPVTGPAAVYEMMLPELKGLDHEECWAIFLDRSNRVLSRERLTSGGTASTVIDVRNIVHRALRKGAEGIILVHNHPGGNPHPSVEDIKNTASLRKAASACQLSLVDHVIFCDSSWFSFSEDKSILRRCCLCRDRAP